MIMQFDYRLLPIKKAKDSRHLQVYFIAFQVVVAQKTKSVFYLFIVFKEFLLFHRWRRLNR